jgi:hypothetical protein
MNLNNESSDNNSNNDNENINKKGENNEKIKNYFNSLKSVKPEINGKEEIIDHLIKINDNNSGAPSLTASAALFIISLLFAAFSAYIAHGAISASELEPAAAVYIGVAPAVETMSLALGSGGEAAVILISLSFFCFISASIIILTASLFLYLFSRPAELNFRGCKPYVL